MKSKICAKKYAQIFCTFGLFRLLSVAILNIGYAKRKASNPNKDWSLSKIRADTKTNTLNKPNAKTQTYTSLADVSPLLC
jgi:hypothetical protein